MPKRTKPPPRTKEKTIDDWLVILGALGMGGLLIGWGISNGWNLELIVFGLIFGGASVLGTPEFRLYLKLTVNRVSGKEVFQISEVRNSTVYKGGFHYHEAPNRGKSETERAEIESVREAELLVDEAFQLGGGEDRRFELDLEEGDRLVGEVKASGTLCAYLLTPNSYRSLMAGRGFSHYWASEDVTRTRVSYDCVESRTFYFVVGNKDEDEDNYLSVDVKLRVE